METTQMTKRRRVCSLEPTKIVQAVFARRYVSYLLPALMRLNNKVASEDGYSGGKENAVKYEVNMALVNSASGFSWSNALKEKLQRDQQVNLGKFHVHTSDLEGKTSIGFAENEASAHISSSTSRWPCDEQKELIPLKLSLNSNYETYQSQKPMKRHKALTPIKESSERAEEEDIVINNGLENLRMLIPGGEEMIEEDMIGELGSYIKCLKLQVNILQCLTETK